MMIPKNIINKSVVALFQHFPPLISSVQEPRPETQAIMGKQLVLGPSPNLFLQSLAVTHGTIAGKKKVSLTALTQTTSGKNPTLTPHLTPHLSLLASR